MGCKGTVVMWQIEVQIFDDLACSDDLDTLLDSYGLAYESTKYLGGMDTYSIKGYRRHKDGIADLVARNIASVRHYVISEI